jgi:hypothetical protein
MRGVFFTLIVLAGGHLGYEEVRCVLMGILPVGSKEKLTVVSEALDISIATASMVCYLLAASIAVLRQVKYSN